ncbi:MAG TPA: DUF4440 domain-containing protein [Ignavibacteria bacterium]|nr:DUF4440 domain-containing protein [Ignavibacteria bacterium]HRA99101.1 DUF4440 domain-containing protein [Ignavibacteria bacterium]
MTKSEIIRKYLGSYETGERKTIENILSEEFIFSSPQDDHIDRAAYFEKCWPMNTQKPFIPIETIVESGEEAFVIYDCNMSGMKFRNTEYIKFSADKIISVEVFFGNEIKN